MEEERLDPHYFSTTPKNSWELFKWIFTESVKLNIFFDNLSYKKRIIYFIQTYLWITILNIILNMSIFFILNLNRDLYTWVDLFYIYLIIGFLSLVLGSIIIILNNNHIFLFIFIIIFTFIFHIGLNLGFSIENSLKFGFVCSITYNLIKSHPFIGGILIGLFLELGAIIGSKIGFAKIDLINILLTILIIGFMIGFIYKIITIGIPYIYHTFYGFFININLEKNSYLKNGYISLPIYGFKKKLSNDSFNRPTLVDDFILFLFKFRPYQRKLAFYLSNIHFSSILYNNKLSIESILIPKDYEENQPTENFTKTLTQLKNELGKYQTQNNIQFKIDSLKNIIEILKNLEQQMIIEKRGWSEYYLKAIRANLDEANAQLKNLELEAKNREPITPNIYNIGDPLSPNYQNQLFKGRKDVVDRLSNIIYTSAQMPLLLIQGQRRVGKTSLINYLEQLLGSGFKIVKLDMQSATNKRFDSLVQNINQELNEMLGIDETIETSDDILQSWIAFEEYLTKHTKALNYKIIIAFDEYEAFHKHIVKKHGEDILENMRSFMQSQNQVIFLFSGMLRLSDLTSPNWDEYFPHAQRLKVDYLSREESLELITNPVEDFNLVYADEVANEVYELTMGHPQLLQTICSIIVTIANSENQKEVTKAMVAKAKEQVFEINEMPMTIFWREFCGESEREVMEQILANEEIIKETKEQKRAVARLVDYGFIGADMMIRVPLFEKWLIERRDLVEL